VNSADAYAYAWSHAERNPDGSLVEASLVELIKDNVDFDADAAKRGLAQRILARRRRPGQTAPAGEVVFPGMEHYAYEPHRVLGDDRGNIIENAAAPVRFKTAEARRAQVDAQAAVVRASREQREAGHFADWTAEELIRGRDPREVTWDACVRDTGLWKDADITGDGPGEDDQ
jgi:hypothetical protein